MFFQFPLSLVRYRAFLDIVMLTFCWNIRKVITICLFNIRNIVIWCVRFFLSGKTLKGTHPQQLKHALICNLDVSLECTNFQMKTIFSIKRFEQLLIWSKLCGESLCLWQSSNIFILNVCWISNTTAATHIILCFRPICIQTVAFCILHLSSNLVPFTPSYHLQTCGSCRLFLTNRRKSGSVPTSIWRALTLF